MERQAGLQKSFKVAAYVVAGLLAVLVLGPFLVPVGGAPGKARAAELAAANGDFVEVNGLTVYTETLGEGQPAVVLLHGYGASVYSWRGVMPALAAQGETVIAYDRPAFGFTQRPMPEEWQEGVNPYRDSCQPELLIGLLDELGIARAVLIGHSAGGRVAVLTALTYPERVRALILVDPALYGGLRPSFLRVAENLPQVNRLGPRLVRSIQERGVDLIYRAWYDPTQVDEEVIAGYKAPLQLANWDRALWEYSKVAGDAAVEDRLGELYLPVLVVSGENDEIVPVESSMRAAQDIPGAQLAVFPRCGHVPNEECPADFLAAVQPFLAALQP